MKMKRLLITLSVAALFFLSGFIMTGNAVSKCSKSITKGKNLYKANCFSCHGKKGKIHHIRRENRRSFLREVLGANKRSHREKHNDDNDYDNGNDKNHNDNIYDNKSENTSENSSMPSFKGTLSKNDVKRIYLYMKNPKKACRNGSGSGNGNIKNPTYTNNISSLFSTHCTACHNSSSAAKGVKLDNYSDAAANASAVKTVVDNGTMPPSGALSASLVTTIDNWVANGAPQ